MDDSAVDSWRSWVFRLLSTGIARRDQIPFKELSDVYHPLLLTLDMAIKIDRYFMDNHGGSRIVDYDNDKDMMFWRHDD